MNPPTTYLGTPDEDVDALEARWARGVRQKQGRARNLRAYEAWAEPIRRLELCGMREAASRREFYGGYGNRPTFCFAFERDRVALEVNPVLPLDEILDFARRVDPTARRKDCGHSITMRPETAIEVLRFIHPFMNAPETSIAGETPY